MPMSRGRPSRPSLTKTDLGDIRHSLRDSAREVGQAHEDFLEARMAGRGVMAAPQALQRDSKRWGGGYRSAHAADYGWFYKLSRAEQARLRDGWLSTSPSAESPDEVAERIDLTDWLNHTRRVDAARALQTGRHVAADRYGGLNPNNLIAGSPVGRPQGLGVG